MIPSSGSPEGGTEFIISGTGFLKTYDKDKMSLKINNENCKIISVNPNQIKAETPKATQNGTFPLILSING